RSAGKSAEARRRIRHPEGGVPDLRRTLAQRLGDDAQRIQVRSLALVGRHASGGVALHMLDGAEAFPRGEGDVARGDVILEIDKSPKAFTLAGSRQYGSAPIWRPLPAGALPTAKLRPGAGVNPAAAAACCPAAWPSASASSRPTFPPQAPAERTRSTELSGRKA